MKPLRSLLFSLIIALYALPVFAGKQVFVSVQRHGLKEYIEIHRLKDTLYGFYYGYRGYGPQQTYFRAPLIIEQFGEDAVRFSIKQYQSSFREITPFSDTAVVLIDSWSDRAPKAPYIFNGSFREGRLVLNKAMAYAASAFERLVFVPLDDQ